MLYLYYQSNQNIRTMKAIARFTTKAQAEAFRNRAFETAGKSLMIVEADGYELHTRKSAAAMEKQGYNVY